MYSEHWNKVYDRSEVDKLGWHEPNPEPSLRLIEMAGVPLDAAILDVGSGSSTLIPALLDRGYAGVVATDVSEQAIAKAVERLGERSEQVDWIVDDVTHPGPLLAIGEVDLWHDRAMLHFLLTDRERDDYLRTLRRLLRSGGFAIIATFALEGVTKCSGLDVRRYDQTMLLEFLGREFRLLNHFSHEYVTPGGESRPYVYCLFGRVARADMD